MDEEKAKETKKQKKVPFWLEVLAVVIAIIGGINGIIQPYLPKGPTAVTGEITVNLAQQAADQLTSYDQSAALQVSVDDYVLDGTHTYCITAKKDISIEWVSSQSCRSITYQIGDRDPITVKSSKNVELRFSGTWEDQQRITLKVSAEGANGEQTAEQSYSFINCVPSDSIEDPLGVYSNGFQLYTGDKTFLLSKGQPIYVMNDGVQGYKELYYKIGTGEMVTVAFSGFYELIPPDSYADTGAFSLQISARRSDGVQIPWVQYILKTTAK